MLRRAPAAKTKNITLRHTTVTLGRYTVRCGAAMRCDARLYRKQEKTTVLITFTFESIMKRFRKLKRLHVAWEVGNVCIMSL